MNKNDKNIITRELGFPKMYPNGEPKIYVSVEIYQGDLSKTSVDLSEKLLENGWYPSISIINKDLDHLFEPTPEELNNVMIQFIKNNINEMKSNIINTCSNRKNIIYDCFDAHEKGIFTLSIPVMLTQVDGICKEIDDLGINFFKNIRDKEDIIRPKVSIKIKDLDINRNIFEHSLIVYPLENSSQVSKSEHNDFEIFNRHTILHGNNTTYNTEINSYKSIAMLNYISDLRKYFIIKNQI